MGFNTAVADAVQPILLDKSCDWMKTPNEKLPSNLEAYLRYCEKVSGLSACIYDLDFFSVEIANLALSAEARSHESPFCLLVKRLPGTHDRCVADELKAARDCLHQPEPRVHTCYAGLSELKIPLRKGRRHVGTLCLGQSFVDTPEHRRRIKQIATRHGGNISTLMTAAVKQSIGSDKELTQWALLAGLLRHFVERHAELELPIAGGPKPHIVAPPVSSVDPTTIPNFFLDRLSRISPALQPVLASVRVSYWRKESETFYAAPLGLSRRGLNNMILKEIDITFRDLIKRARMAAAAYLLKRLRCNVTQTSFAVGYESPAAFSRAFKSVMYLSPSHFSHGQTSTYDMF